MLKFGIRNQKLGIVPLSFTAFFHSSCLILIEFGFSLPQRCTWYAHGEKSWIYQNLVGSSGLEPPTSRLSGVRSNHLSYEPIWFGVSLFPFYHTFYSLKRVGGDERDRTDDPLLAKQVLSQLSYTPKYLLKIFIRPSKLNNDLSKSPELTLDVKSVMFQTD